MSLEFRSIAKYYLNFVSINHKSWNKKELKKFLNIKILTSS